MRIPFTLRGVDGHVDVSITANTNPDAIGYSLLFEGSPAEFRVGFPICRARVSYPGDGYAAVFGWTQMVRSTDQTGQFEMDPIAIYAEVATPFAWFGVKPEAFDAPSRESVYDMVWEAHCFLCVSPDAVLTRRAQALCGFSWGFAVEPPQIHFTDPEPLLRRRGMPISTCCARPTRTGASTRATHGPRHACRSARRMASSVDWASVPE